MGDGWISFTELTQIGPELLHARISENPRAAARWVEAAALNGIVSAQIAWGQMLVDGHGVPRDPEAGLRWFHVAAAAGSAEGLNMVGRAHEFGWGTPADPARAAPFYRQAADAGHGWGQFNLAILLLDGRGVAHDRVEALRWFARAARRGHAKAATLVGRYLEHGWDRPARPTAALRWYRRGAEGGDYRGQFDYARLLLERTGRLDIATPWFARSIETGVPAFCRNVAAALRDAPHPALHRLAARALQRAAESGEPGDLRAYGAALAQGLGDPPDAEGAAYAFRRARAGEAEAGNSRVPPPLAADKRRAARGATACFRAVLRLLATKMARGRRITNTS